MWLIFGSYGDRTAHWAYRGLSRMGLAPLHLVLAETLVHSQIWEHRVGARGVATRITLPDGRAVPSSEVKGVLNRLTAPSAEHIRNAAPGDYDYANSELTAFYLSWLYSLPCRVINRATPQGLCGRWRHHSEWVALAVRAGLAVSPFRQSSQDSPQRGYEPVPDFNGPRQTVIVLSDKVFGVQLPKAVQVSCIRLAELAEMDALAITIATRPEGAHVFQSASTMPDLEAGGVPLLEHLASTLRPTGGLQ